MVPEGSMMRPFPIAPLDMVWMGWTEYIPAVGGGRSKAVVASSRSRHQVNGAWGGKSVSVHLRDGPDGKAQRSR